MERELAEKGLSFFGDLLDKLLDFGEWMHAGQIAQAVYAAYPEIREDTEAVLGHLGALIKRIKAILAG